MKTLSRVFGQRLCRIVPSIVRESSSRHDPLLINRLAAFNFRPLLLLDFPGERTARTTNVSQ
jgi:hypothetical protein